MIEFKKVYKSYNDVEALKDISLSIRDGEIFGLVGKSGAGKSTLLRTINQLEKIDSGDILIDGKSVCSLKGKELRLIRKKIGMIFQNFSLMETQTVYQNIALPLKCVHCSKSTIDKKVHELAQLVDIEDKLNKKPRELSGGQKQRVAIARAIILKPKILLLDETLSVLDLKLRQNMQYELKEMQRNLGITFLFVTHDQEEAMVMSDRIVVMKDGLIQQLGTPKDIYTELINRYVATFIGDSNIVSGIYLKKDVVRFLDVDFPCVGYVFEDNEPVDVVIRPEDWDVVPLDRAKLIGTVRSSIFKGVHYELVVDLCGMEFVVHTYEDIQPNRSVGLSVDPYEICLMKVDGSCKTIVNV